MVSARKSIGSESPGHRGFFSIDRGAFRCAAVAGLNPAIAYLVMARGTGRDNITTQWSVNAIEQRTGISRPNADKAVKDLLSRGIWRKTRDGKHPIYEAVLGNLIPGGPFTIAEQTVIAAIGGGKRLPYEIQAAAGGLRARGIVRDRSGGRRNQCFELDHAAIAALTEPFTVWLPNALIDGASDEVPPIELIRQTGDLCALRLIIELYAAQFLPHYGGIPRELLKGAFERVKVGEQGPFVVWGVRSKHITAGAHLYRLFLAGQQTTRDHGKRADTGMESKFWPAVHILEDLGLIERVGMLVEGDDDAAEIIHPYGIRGGEPAERELGTAAQIVAEAMITEGQRSWANSEGYYLVPVLRHIAEATVVEVFRLKYRPHTKATAAWYALMQQSTAKHLGQYQALMQRRATATA